MILSPLLWASLQWNCNILIMIKFIVKFDKVNWQIYFGYCLASPCGFSIISIRKKLSYFINLLSAKKKTKTISYTLAQKTITFLLCPCMPHRKQGCHFEKDGSVQSLVMWPGQPHLKHPRWWQVQWRCPMKPHRIHIFSCHWNKKNVSDKQMNKIHEHIVNLDKLLSISICKLHMPVNIIVMCFALYSWHECHQSLQFEPN